MAAIDQRYDAFISYNHAADSDTAAAVERGLQRLAKPWYRLRAVSIFRDLSDTGLNPSLWGTVQKQLEQSGWLILLACPESAASPWVGQEVDHWCETKGTDSILIVLTGGELVWDRAAGRFADATTALKPEFAERFDSEPLHLDLRWTKAVAQPTLALARFRTDMARLASPIRNLPPDEIEGEDIRLHRNARRLARGAVAVLVTLAVIASIAAVVAVANARRAERRAREATARQVGLAALDMPASELDRALLMSIIASDLDPDAGVERFRSGRTLLGRHSRLVELLHVPSVEEGASLRGIAVADDGNRVAATAFGDAGAPRLVTWDTTSDEQPTSTEMTRSTGANLAFSDGGTVVLGDVGMELSTGRMGETPTGGLGVMTALDIVSGRALTRVGGVARLVDIDEGEVLREWPTEGDLAALDGARAAFAGPSIQLFDTDTGAHIATGPATGIGLDPVDAIAVDADHDTVATASDRGDVTIWSIGDVGDELVATSTTGLPAEVGTPRHIALGHDGQHVIVVGDHGTALVDTVESAVVATDRAAGGLSLDPSGRFAVVGGTRLTIWDLGTGQRVISVPEKANAMKWSACADDPCRLITAGESIDVWEATTGRRTRLADQTNAQAVAITGDGSTAVTAGWGSTVAIWDLDVPIDDSGRTVRAPAGAPSSFDSVSGAMARLVDRDTVTIENGDDERRIVTGHATGIWLIADASRLLVSDSETMRLFDTTTGRQIDVDRRCVEGSVAVSPLGGRVVGHRSTDGRTVVCSTTDGTMVAGAMIIGPSSPARSVAVDDDGSVALGGGGFIEYHQIDDGTFRPQGSAIDTSFGGEPDDITALAVRSGHVAAGIRPLVDDPARVLVWDAAGDGTPVQFDTDHSDIAAVGLLGADAGLVVVAGQPDPDSADVVAQVWERENRRRLGRGLGGLEGDVVALGGDETTVVGTDAGGRTFTWSLDRDPRREICEIVGRALSSDEWSTIANRALDRYDFTPVCNEA